MTEYFVVNKKGEVIDRFYNKEEAIEKMNKGIKRGWNWRVKKIERTCEPPEWWEMAGYKQDPTKVNYGHSLLEHFG